MKILRSMTIGIREQFSYRRRVGKGVQMSRKRARRPMAEAMRSGDQTPKNDRPPLGRFARGVASAWRVDSAIDSRRDGEKFGGVAGLRDSTLGRGW